jgi:hypothetical protein
MNAFSDGFVTLLNGLRDALAGATNPVALAFIVCGVALAWLALVEIDLLNRAGTKPRIGRH